MASGYACAFLVLGKGPVDAGRAGVLALAFAGRDDQIRSDLFDRLAVRAAPENGVQHVGGDDRRAA